MKDLAGLWGTMILLCESVHAYLEHALVLHPLEGFALDQCPVDSPMDVVDGTLDAILRLHQLLNSGGILLATVGCMRLRLDRCAFSSLRAFEHNWVLKDELFLRRTSPSTNKMGTTFKAEM